MAEVCLTSVSKVYASGVSAVDNFNLVVRDGEFLVLVGPSGCGKSTTLRMIAGLEEITAGTIDIDGYCVNQVPPKDRDIAMVFQNYALYPHMNVFDNMAFGLKLRGMARAEIRTRVHAAADILGLNELLRRLPKQLSGGQRQRVAVGRAIVRQPRVFLFDEPLSNLDAKMRVEMRGEIIRLHQRLGATMIYVTHDQAEAMTMGDRIVVMHEGTIQQAAAPLEVYRQPANLFVAGFIGTPPMNRLRGSLRQSSAEWLFEHAGGELVLPPSCVRYLRPDGASDIWLGFRPEALGTPVRSVNQLSGRVDLVEPMGAETFIQLIMPCGARVMARVEAGRQVAAGTELSLPLDLEAARLFDTSSGQALT